MLTLTRYGAEGWDLHIGRGTGRLPGIFVYRCGPRLRNGHKLPGLRLYVGLWRISPSVRF